MRRTAGEVPGCVGRVAGPDPDPAVLAYPIQPEQFVQPGHVDRRRHGARAVELREQTQCQRPAAQRPDRLPTADRAEQLVGQLGGLLLGSAVEASVRGDGTLKLVGRAVGGRADSVRSDQEAAPGGRQRVGLGGP